MKDNFLILMSEIVRPKWTFHAKGLWYSPPGEVRPMLTLVGSPNFGYRLGTPNHLCTIIVYIVRSVERDLETQIVVVTSNDGLRDRLQQERDALFKYGTPVTAQVQKATLCAFYLNLTSDLGRTRAGCTLVGRQGSWDCQELFLVYIYLSVIDYS